MDKLIRFNNPLPEYQIKPPYKIYSNEIIGNITLTGGFMEPYGHGRKRTSKQAIFSNGKILKTKTSNYNIGLDYTTGYKSKVIAWYSGTVIQTSLERGYGNRIYIKLNIPFTYKGKDYDCYQAYAHNYQILKKKGDKVKQGEAIALEGGHNGSNPLAYGSHVDLDTYIFMDNEKIHINPDLLSSSDRLESIYYIPTLKKDNTGLGVIWLQHHLKKHNLSLKIDGYFGAKTEAMVKDFQRNNNLKVDGIVGNDTRNRFSTHKLFLYIKENTIAKERIAQSSDLNKKEKTNLYKNSLFEISNHQSIGDHFKIINDDRCYYIYKPHANIIQNN